MTQCRETTVKIGGDPVCSSAPISGIDLENSHSEHGVERSSMLVGVLKVGRFSMQPVESVIEGFFESF